MLDEIAQKIVHKDKQGDQKIKGGFSLTKLQDQALVTEPF